MKKNNMNREIKFRGKSLKYGDWLFGSLWIDKEDFYITHEKESEKAGESSYTYVTEVVPSTIGQYTGIKDKNGREIYEGDIVENGGYYNIMGVVRYDTEYAHYFIRNSVESMDFAEISSIEVEVVGNIHDNPELSKGGDK